MAAIRITAEHITPACRLHQGDEKAFNAAVHRLRQEYLSLCASSADQTTLNLVLTMDKNF